MSSHYKTAEPPWFGEMERTVGTFHDGHHIVAIERADANHAPVWVADGKGDYLPLDAVTLRALEGTDEWRAAMTQQPQPPVWLVLTDNNGFQQLVEGTQEIAGLLS